MDQSRDDGPYDLLYADVNLSGSLAGAEAIRATEVEGSERGCQVVSRVVRLLPGPDGMCA